MPESHPEAGRYEPHSSGFSSFLRKENSVSKTGTENAGFWESLSENLYNRLKAFGIVDPSGMEVKFDFEFNLPIKDQGVPMLIQIKKRVESEAAEAVDIEMLRRRVSDIIGNSKLKRFVAELDKNGNIRPVYFVDLKNNVVSL